MIFPIGDNQVQGGHKPIFAYLFIAFNVLVFFFEISMNSTALQDFVTEYGSIPVEIMNGQDWYTLFTSMFMHGGWMHLIGNMLFLWVFGDNIEAIVGSIVFIAFYITGGIAAEFTHAYLYPNSIVPTVGASGAIAAVMGAYLVMFPLSRIKVWVLFFTFEILAIFFLGFWILNQFTSGFAALNPELAESAGVAFWAHIGGFVFGVVCGFIFRMFYDVKLIQDPPPMHSYQSKKGRERFVG